MIDAVIKRFTATALKRFGGACTSLEAKRRGSSIVFEFSVAGTNAQLEVNLGSDFLPTKVRSAFVELGMEIERLKAVRDARN